MLEKKESKKYRMNKNNAEIGFYTRKTMCVGRNAKFCPADRSEM